MSENSGEWDNRLKSLLNRGESSVLDVAEAVCDATGTKTFAKIRIADVVKIERSGIPDDLYRYALSAHFDVLVSQGNKAFLAIEFDGPLHNARNDKKKAEICEHFGIPLVRVQEAHLDAKVFEDVAIAFFIWQLFCVDAFLDQYGNDQYEPYDPAWFVSVAGKNRQWPFAYEARWRGRLRGPFTEAAGRFHLPLSDFYSHGLVQFGAVDFTYRRGLDYRSICGQLVGEDRLVWGEAELNLEVFGLRGRRLELFGEIASFVEGMAAERMYGQAMLFLDGEHVAASRDSTFAKETMGKRGIFHKERFVMENLTVLNGDHFRAREKLYPILYLPANPTEYYWLPRHYPETRAPKHFAAIYRNQQQSL